MPLEIISEGIQLKFGTRMMAALILILLSAFGVFCRYYHWKVPGSENEEKENVALGQPQDVTLRRDYALKRTRQKKRR